MRFTPTIFAKLLEPIDRRRFAAIVARHDGDAYDESFFRGSSGDADLRAA